MVNRALQVSYHGDATNSVASVTPSVRYSHELDWRIQKCRSLVVQAQKSLQPANTGGHIKYSKSDSLDLTFDERTKIHDEFVRKRRKKSHQIGNTNPTSAKRWPDDGERERLEVQRRLDELLRDPAADLVIANPRSSMSGDLQTASEIYKKQVDRFKPDDDDSSYDESYSSSSSLIDLLDKTGDWITSPASSEGWSFLCCIPGE